MGSVHSLAEKTEQAEIMFEQLRGQIKQLEELQERIDYFIEDAYQLIPGLEQKVKNSY